MAILLDYKREREREREGGESERVRERERKREREGGLLWSTHAKRSLTRLQIFCVKTNLFFDLY